MTEYLVIRTDLKGEQAKYLAYFFDEIYRYFSREYIPIKQKDRLTMLLYSSSRAYNKSHWRQRSEYGCYLGLESNTIIVNLSSGLGTATHELVHHFMAVSNIADYPDWINEGLPTFFEKFIGYFDNNEELHISFGYFSNWRFPITKSYIDKYQSGELLTTDSQCLCRAFILYLHKQHYLKQFIRKLYDQEGKIDGIRTLELVCGKDFQIIENEWKDWVKSQPINGNVKLVTRSFVHPYSDWQKWLKKNQEHLSWDDEQEIYVVNNP